MKYIKWNGRRSGFMLSENLLALLVTILVIGILQQTLKIIKNVPENMNADQIRWHMTNEYIQDKFQGEHLKSVTQKKLIFNAEDESSSVHVLEFYQDMLRFRSEAGGHVPLITGLKRGNFIVKDDLIVIKMTNKQNQVSEMYLTNDQ